VNQVGTTLLPGERLSWAVEDVGDVAASTDKAIDEKYARGEVRIVTEHSL